MEKHKRNIVICIILAFMSFINLVFMHYNIAQYVEVDLDITSYIDNTFGIIFDLSTVSCLSFVLFRGNIKKVLGLCFFTSFTWAFTNILYSRFFFQYLSSSSIAQTGNIFNSLLLRCIIDSLRWTDLYFLLIFLCGIFIYRYINYTNIKKKWFFGFISLIFLCSCIIDISTTILYSFSTPLTKNIGYIKHHLFTHHFDLYRNSANPNWTCFQRGSLRFLIQPQIHAFFSINTLTQKQIDLINREIYAQDKRITKSNIPNIENIIFIIIESYLSITSDMVVDGKEITPYLNALKKDSTVCYNGRMKSNITIGESGDGQFICMTGLLPLRSEITIGKAKNITLPGLPKVLSKKMRLETRMLIPTTPSMWEQEQMCKQYGFSKLYSSNDFNSGKGDLNDEQIFQHLISIDKKSTSPFLSVVLTMSMHQPYDHNLDRKFELYSKQYSEEFLYYLNACHYTDYQIGKYLKFLKDNGIYDKSLIIITADHHPNPNSLRMNNLHEDIPLYIINSGMNNNFYSGECQQIDIYSTILDILIKDHLTWRGLGNSLISPTYSPSISQQKWDLSEWIIQSNYFQTRHF